MSDLILKLGMNGDPVSALHKALNQLGFSVPSSEVGQATFGAGTQDAVRKVQTRLGLQPTGEVDTKLAAELSRLIASIPAGVVNVPPVAAPVVPPVTVPPIIVVPPPEKFTVKGFLRSANGAPLAGALVIAVDKDLRSEKELGRAKTDASGAYSVEYTKAQFANPAEDSADIIVRAYTPDANNNPAQLLVASDIVFDAQAVETINLLVGGGTYRGLSEFETIVADLQPLLGKLTPGDLVEMSDAATTTGAAINKDLSFLVGETGRTVVQLALFSIAYRMARATDLQPELFYGLMKEDVPSGVAAMAMVASTAFAIDLDANAKTILSALYASRDTVRSKAIDAAFADDTLPLYFKPTAPEALKRFAVLASSAALTQPVGKAKGAFGDVLNATAIPASVQTQFMALYANYSGSMGKFWKQLGQNKAFTAQQVADLKFTHTVNRLAKGHVPLIGVLAQMRQTSKIKRTSDLGRLDEADWTGILNQPAGAGKPPVGAPQGMTVANYAHFLATGFERAYPTTALIGRMTKDLQSPVPARSDVLAFLNSNPNFSIPRTNLDRYLKDNKTALTGVQQPTGMKDSLLILQRMSKVAPAYSLLKPLIADKVQSSQQIYFMGHDQFLKKYGPNAAVGTSAAEEIFRKSEQIYAQALALVSNLNLSFNRNTPVAVQNPSTTSTTQQAIKDFPNLQTLFGSLDLCQCEDCRSVLSPAAYLVDLLHFLNKRQSNGPTNPTRSVKDVLFDRRPDLGLIELSCPNTTVPLPYIDLVNEILEDAVSPPATPTSRQTSGSADELAANPAYKNQSAYDTLAGAIFPWTLPFNLPLEEARAYLGQMKVSRSDLMKVFQPPATATSAQAHSIAIESLGLSSMEAQIITPSALTATFHSWDFWGLLQAGNSIVDPVDPTITIAGDWITVLSHVRVMMNRAGLSFTELSQLLNTRFINGDNALQLVPDPSADCDLGKMTISGLTADLLDRIRGFVRLWRKLGWTIYEVDKTIMSLQSGVANLTGRLNDTLVWQICQIAYAVQALSLPVVTILSFWSTLDSFDVPPLAGETLPQYCLYNVLFQNKVVLNPVDPVFQLNATGTEIAGAASNEKISGHKAAILAALGISDADLTLAATQITPDDKLNLANLSTLYRHFALASAMSLTIKQLLSLKSLTEIDPFDITTPELLGVFLAKAKKINNSGFTVEQLDYLLRHVYTDASGLYPQNIVIGTLLREMRIGLQKIQLDNIFVSDPTGQTTKKKLALLLKPADVDSAMGILNGTTTLSATDQNTFIANSFSAFLNVAQAQTNLVGAVPPALSAGQPRFDYVLSALLNYLARTQSVNYVTQQLTDAVQADAATVRGLLNTYLKARFDTTKPSIEEFLRLPSVPRGAGISDSTPVDPVAEPAFQTAFDTFRLLQKCATVFSTFELTATEVAWLFANGTTSTRKDFVTGFTAGWLDPTGLPLAPLATSGIGFVAWERVADFVTLRNILPAGQYSITTLFDEARATTPAVSKSQFYADLSARTQWTVANLEILGGVAANTAALGLLGLQYPQDYQDEFAMVRMLPCFQLMQSLGISADVSKWIGADVQQPDADALKQVVKAKYPVAQWLTIAKPLRDGLRTRQRDSLVAYLLAKPPAQAGWFRDVNDIYGYYLIDVQMSPCQLTARLKQAAASVQLFVQRCLLSAEKDVVADAVADSDWLQWQWMEYYRVWQANREVFLYPENWIDPKLRRDKSPFFQELENELLQSDVNQDSAENAFRNYLEKLDQVARLRVVGTFFEAESDGNILHVFARSQSDPPTYYYRQRQDGYKWTAWSKVDVAIDSNHVLPILWNRRLYLFWLIFAEKPNTDTGSHVPAAQQSNTPPTLPATHYEIQLAWSEFKDKKWQPKFVSPQKLYMDAGTSAYRFTAKTFEQGAALAVDIFWQDDQSNGFPHVGEFLLSGVGNNVQAFKVTPSPVEAGAAGDDARHILPLPTTPKLDLILPSASDNDFMSLAPSGTAPLSSDRNRQVSALNVLYNYYGTLKNEELLVRADRYEILVPHQDLLFDSTLPFFVQDTGRSFFVVPSIFYKNGNYFLQTRPAYGYNPFYIAEYRFYTYYHSFVTLFTRELNRAGVPGLLNRTIQVNPLSLLPGSTAFDFNAYYGPTADVQTPYPAEDVDFNSDGAYSIYNWELFFHAPLLIANALSSNQKFDDARKWYQYIFDPTSATNDSSPQRYWITKPFFKMTASDYQSQTIQNLLVLIAQGDTNAEFQVAQWRKYPFDPHVIAALRPVAYQRSVVMKYIDNLIAWGDQLFRRDTIETINEATQLYVLAQELLGPRPQIVPEQHQPKIMTYNDLEPHLDDFSDELVAVENIIAPPTVNTSTDPSTPKLPTLMTLYFCVPPNDTLLGYWDTVEDRLFKIRHCMNIEGVVQQLPLYEPPINPGLLVQAAAAGLDLNSVLSDLSAPLPHYRFTYMMQKARELTGVVKSLGAALLQVLEKRDAEALALLRSSGEVQMLNATKTVKQRMLDEATQSVDVLNKTQTTVTDKRNYYRDIAFMNAAEITSMVLTIAALIPDVAAIILEATAGVGHMIPDMQFGASGFGGTPLFYAKIGGENVGSAASKWAEASRIASAVLHAGAQLSSVIGSYQRRSDEWGLQRQLADDELAQIASQIIVAQIRQDIADKEIKALDTQIDTSSKVDDLLHSKYTNQDLYEWMISQTATVFFQGYQLAYEVAKQAERCYRYELGLTDSSFIQFGYWDSLKKGLLSGEKLESDLLRLEMAYVDANARELELTRSFSLLSLDPVALVKLRENGSCVFQLPELAFDLETPGHYMRRLKNISLTIPCVVGPYTNVSASLSLMQNSTRLNADLTGGYKSTGASDPRFRGDSGGVEMVVTSNAQNDSGLFELNLRDERYLPFEGSGAISSWLLKLTAPFEPFDYESISDIILHMRYTSRDGGDNFRSAVITEVKADLNKIALAESRQGLYRAFSMRHDFPTNWQKFLFPPAGTDQVMVFDTAPTRFPFFTRGMQLTATSVELIAKLKNAGAYTAQLTLPGGTTLAPNPSLTADNVFGTMHHWGPTPFAPAVKLGSWMLPPQAAALTQWSLKLQLQGAADFQSLTPDEVDDILVSFKYEVK
jgi:peptidoglycan hydrolase-like protein with peptidoglycan-binding domain